MKNMPSDYPNGSYSVQSGIKISAEAKFEMLRSEIYPRDHK